MSARTDSIEILYVAGSSLDKKGKRVLVRGEGVENYFYSVDEVQDGDLLKLLGISKQQKVWMEKFLSGSPNV